MVVPMVVSWVERWAATKAVQMAVQKVEWTAGKRVVMWAAKSAARRVDWMVDAMVATKAEN